MMLNSGSLGADARTTTWTGVVESPAAVTAKFREMGDTVSRLDRYEPDLGLVLSGDLRDTTTPLAMAQLVRRITTGTVLRPDSRQRLLQWMENTKTGERRLRAGLPADWRAHIAA